MEGPQSQLQPSPQTREDDCKSLSVLFFKSPKEKGPDPYAEECLKRGYIPHFVPVLSFSYINGDEVTRELQTHDGGSGEVPYCGLIITSQQALESIQHFCFLNDKETEDKKEEKKEGGKECLARMWRGRLLYCVGRETALKLATMLQLSPSVLVESGNEEEKEGVEEKEDEEEEGKEGKPEGRILYAKSAKELALRIVQERKGRENGRLLYICGNLRREELPEVLRNHGVRTKEVCAYSTSTSLSIPPHLAFWRTAVKHGREGEQTHCVDWICFFSPSGVQSVWEVIESERKEGAENVWPRVAVIGPTTNEAFEKVTKRKANAIAASPTAEALLEAIQRASSEQGN